MSLSAMDTNGSNADTQIKSFTLKQVSFSSLIDSLNRQGVEFVLRDSELSEVSDVRKAQFLEVKLGPEKVQGFYIAAIIVKDLVALSRCETLRSIISKTTSIACPKCLRCGSYKLIVKDNATWCLDYNSYLKTVDLNVLDVDKIYIVRLDLTNVDDVEKVLGGEGVLKGDNVEIVARGYITISRYCEIERGFDHIYTVMDFELKDIVERLGLKALSRLSRAPEEQEIERLANKLGISKELVAQLRELRSIKRLTERQTIAASLIMDAIIEHFRHIKNFSLIGGGDIGIHCFDGKRWRDCENDVKSYIDKVYRALKLDSWGIKFSALVREAIMLLENGVREYLKYYGSSIAFNNCVLDWNTLKCKEHDPSKVVFHFIPHDIDFELLQSLLKEIRSRLMLSQQEYEAVVEMYASRYTPKTLKAFKEWVGNKWILLYEILGFVLYPKPYKKAVLLTDAEGREGDTGKSTYIRYLQLVLGPESYSSVPLQALTDLNMRFVASQIYRKLANFYADLPEKALTDVGAFKVITGEDAIIIEKKYREPFSWTPYTKHIFSANTPPPVSNADMAFWKRWLLIQFIGGFEKKVKEFEKTLVSEIPKAIAIGVACFYYVLQRGGFSYENTPEDAKHRWLARADSVYAFMNWAISSQVLRKDDRSSIRVSDIYEVYTKWCRAVGEDPVVQNRFTLRLKQLGYQITHRGAYSCLKGYTLDKEKAKELLEKEAEEIVTERTEQRTIEEHLQ